MQNSIILRRHDYHQFEGNNFMLWFRTILYGTVVGVLYQLYFQGITHWSLYALTLSLFSLGFFFYSRFIKKTKIEISDFGIEYKSGVPDFLNSFDPNWKVSWMDIQEVSFTKGVVQNALFTPLYIKLNSNSKLASRTIKLIPSQWGVQKKPIKKLSFKDILNKKENYKILVENSPLIKIFEKKGFLKENNSVGKLEAGITDINSNPIALGIATFFVISVFYFVGDVYFGLSEFYADTPPYVWNIVVGILIALVAYLVLKATKLKFSEKLIMTVLVGFGAALVAYPLFLRFNEWTDAEGLNSYSYRLYEKGIWMPKHNNIQLPELTFDLKSSKYWGQFKVGAVKDFELRKGGLGFYQLNMKPVYEEQREFYGK